MDIIKKIKRTMRICMIYVTVYRVGPALVIGGLVSMMLGSIITWNAIGRFYPGRRDFISEVFEFATKRTV